MKTPLRPCALVSAVLLLGACATASDGEGDLGTVDAAVDAGGDVLDVDEPDDTGDIAAGGDAEADGGDAEPSDATPGDVGQEDVTLVDVAQTDVASTCDAAECAAKANPCQTGTCFEGACLIEDSSGPCDDGDPCTLGDSCLVGTCAGFSQPGCCTTDCEGKVCGDDGCGGSCGACLDGTVCGPLGSCVVGAVGGDTCADAALVGGLPFEVTSTTKGLQNDYAVPALACNQVALGTYGNDAAFRYVADFTGYVVVTLDGLDVQSDVYVLSDCDDTKYGCSVGTSSTFSNPTLPISAPVEAGRTYFIVVDGSDGGGAFTLSVDACVPDCDGKECGLDGCGHWCDVCPVLSAEVCSTDNECVCVPSCDDKACGDDGCGGSCGECAGGAICDLWGHDCVAEAKDGDRCDDAIAMDVFPFSYSGSTAGYGNDYYSWSFCAGNGTGAYLGDGAPDVAFVLQPEIPTAYYITLETTGFIPALWALPDCSDPIGCIQSGYKGFELDTKLFIEAAPGQPTHVIVSAYQTGAGPFELNAIACTTPESCPGATPGEYCSFANVIESLPFEAHQFGVASSIDAYSLPSTGPCASTKQAGDGASEDAYTFTPTQSGTYTATVTASGQFDPVLYVTTDCLNLETACLASADATGDANTETVTFAADAGTPVYFLVDGFTPYAGPYDLAVDGPL
ncbi:MAG: hypothetical protein IV100_15975 [Myxococcales bacterium]|nr:hypothetical protein [Myxococcales bacterium]